MLLGLKDCCCRPFILGVFIIGVVNGGGIFGDIVDVGGDGDMFPGVVLRVRLWPQLNCAKGANV